MSNTNRVVMASYGYNCAMGYKFQARIEERVGRYGFLWLKKGKRYRYVIEKYHMGWDDYIKGFWTTDKVEAIRLANLMLDHIESSPKGEYV